MSTLSINQFLRPIHVRHYLAYLTNSLVSIASFIHQGEPEDIIDKEGKFFDLLKFYLIQLYKRSNSNELLLCTPFSTEINIFFSNVFPLDVPKDGLEVTGVLKILFSNQLICLVRPFTWSILNDSKLIRSVSELLRCKDLWHRRVLCECSLRSFKPIQALR